MLGVTSYSVIPLRLSIFIGFFAALISLLIGLVYFILKLIFWNSMGMGMAPLVVGVFFFLSIQMLFIGMLGEYIGAIYTHVKRRPLVIEKERVNF
jgi:glycosyltransferase involved in cell wall biosynthesis